MGLRGVGGQQVAEFAVVMGVAAAVAITMQFMARRVIRQGVAHATDTILGVPEPDLDTTAKELDLHSTESVDERGQRGMRRRVRTIATVSGHSVNEDVRLRTVPEPPSR